MKTFSEQTALNRRAFIHQSFGMTATSLLASQFIFSAGENDNPVKAIAFDAFAIFNPKRVWLLADDLFGEKGKALTEAWREKQFNYCWIHMAGHQYKDFWQVTEEALIFAGKKSGVNLSANERKQLMEAFLSLDVWPDVQPAFDELKKGNIKICLLSNMTGAMLEANNKANKIEHYFDQVLSTDQIKTYKPAPAAYEIGVKATRLDKKQIVFAAFAGWDVAGAKWFGYPVFWVNRANAIPEELGVQADGVGYTLTDLVNFIAL